MSVMVRSRLPSPTPDLHSQGILRGRRYSSFLPYLGPFVEGGVKSEENPLKARLPQIYRLGGLSAVATACSERDLLRTVYSV